MNGLRQQADRDPTILHTASGIPVRVVGADSALWPTWWRRAAAAWPRLAALVLRIAALAIVATSFAATTGVEGQLAAQQTIAPTWFSIPTGGSMPGNIKAGADGNLWFPEFAANKMGKISTAGVITEYPLPAAPGDTGPVVGPGHLTAGPDGNIWFVVNGANVIGKITPDGAVTYYQVGIRPSSIANGPDGNVWFTSYQAGYVGRISPTGELTAYPLPGAGQRTSLAPFPAGIATGPDGNLWFTTGRSVIGRMTPAGALTELGISSIPGYPIVVGPDDNLWFTLPQGTTTPAVGKMTVAGVVTSHPLTGATILAAQNAITVGPDGKIWFTDRSAVGTVTTSGDVTVYPIPGAGSIGGITAGPDSNLWLTDQDNNRIGRFTPPPTPRDFLPVAFFEFSPGP